MPPRSVKMKRFIFGFQRRVWWPKWTPASRSSRIETTDTCCPFLLGLAVRAPAGPGGTGVRPDVGTPTPAWPPGSGTSPGMLADPCALERGIQVGRERRLDCDPLAGEGMREGEARRVEELPLEAEIARDAVDGIARDGQLDRSEVDADLVRPPR